jgi:hypothetical protein
MDFSTTERTGTRPRREQMIQSSRWVKLGGKYHVGTIMGSASRNGILKMKLRLNVPAPSWTLSVTNETYWQHIVDEFVKIFSTRGAEFEMRVTGVAGSMLFVSDVQA